MGELSRQRPPRAELRHPRDQCFEHQRSAVAVQLEDVLAGVGMRSGEEEREAGIDRILRGIEEAGKSGPARQRQLAEQHGGDFGHPRTRNAYYPDPPLPGGVAAATMVSVRLIPAGYRRFASG